MKHFLLLTPLLFASLLKAQNINIVAGNGNCCGGGDGIPATTSALYYPTDVAIDASGELFIAEGNSIRKVNTLGIITTYGGTGLGGYNGDGGPATSAQMEPNNVAVDALGNVYCADWFNCVVRKINTSGIITTIAGTGSNGYSGDGGLATNAMLNQPQGLAVDAAGNIYISDSNNHRIRKINTAGIITTVAGNGTGGYNGDSILATTAELNNPIGITLDNSGNLYIADWQNNRIRKVTTAGIISTVAGTGTYVVGFSGDGGPATAAELRNPSDVVCDSDGNIYIADGANLRVRKVDNTGTISTIAGTGGYGNTGDGGPAIDAEFGGLWGMGMDAQGNVYTADNHFNTIRKISLLSGISELGNGKAIALYPNPTSGQFMVVLPADVAEIIVTDMLGQEVLKLHATQSLMNVQLDKNGAYIVHVITAKGSYSQKLIVNN